METLADLVARHAVAVLCAAAVLLLVAAALFWKLLNMYVLACWRFAEKAARALAGTRFAARALDLPVLGRSLSGTMTAARILGLFATLAFIFSAFALALFFELVDEIGADDSLGRFDVELGAALRKHVSYGTLRLFWVITRLGDPEFLLVLSTVVAAGLQYLTPAQFFTRRRRHQKHASGQGRMHGGSLGGRWHRGGSSARPETPRVLPLLNLRGWSNAPESVPV